MNTKLLIVVMVQFFALSWSQNLNFSDVKFKALILTPNSTNGIAKNASGVSITIELIAMVKCNFLRRKI
jgi:hypothetical protein